MYIHILCSLCGTDAYTAVKRTNTKGEKVLDVCHHCNFNIQKTITRHNVRARKKGVPATLTSAQWIEILQKSQGHCHYCKEYEGAMRLTPDHIIPIGKGGANSAENIVAACLFCNIGKNAKSAEQWLEDIRNGYYQQPGITFIRHRGEGRHE